MADINIDKMKSVLTGGGARANYFEASISGLDGLDTDKSVLIKAAQLPASIINPITVPFRGRQLQIAGDRIFEPWSITIINDVNMEIRNAFEAWMQQINAHVSNTVTDDSPASYMKDAIVSQLDRKGNPTKTYDFKGIWPSNISAIDVSYDNENSVEEFTVELQVTYWTSAQSNTNS